MLAMINVGFLMLTFFLLAGGLRQAEPFAVEPPEARHGRAVEGEDTPLLIGRDGRLAYGELVGREAAIAAAAARHAGPTPATLLRVKADARAPTALAVEVMAALGAAGVERLRLLTVPAAP
jgi:biopolymer transport protein ExbD